MKKRKRGLSSTAQEEEELPPEQEKEAVAVEGLTSLKVRAQGLSVG